MMWSAVLYVVLAYLIGAIPTGYIIAKRLKGIDIRDHGSGNVGATNVKRVVGPRAGLATLILDFLKGALPVLGAVLLFPQPVDPYHLVPVFTAVATIVGHSKSIYIGFSGGKSVITSLGAILVLEPVAALITAVFAVTVIKLTRYVSLGSMLGALLLPILVWVQQGPLSHLVMVILIAVFVILRHRDNIVRLWKHQENRL